MRPERRPVNDVRPRFVRARRRTRGRIAAARRSRALSDAVSSRPITLRIWKSLWGRRTRPSMTAVRVQAGRVEDVAQHFLGERPRLRGCRGLVLFSGSCSDNRIEVAETEVLVEQLVQFEDGGELVVEVIDAAGCGRRSCACRARLRVRVHRHLVAVVGGPLGDAERRIAVAARLVPVEDPLGASDSSSA